MKDLLVGILLGIVLVLLIQFFLEIKRIDVVKQNKQHIITLGVCDV